MKANDSSLRRVFPRDVLENIGCYDDLEKIAEMNYRLLKREVLKEYGAYVKNRKALYALAWVVSRAMLVNEPVFPVTVTIIGLGGSAWYRPDPADVDIVVLYERNAIYEEFMKCREALKRNVREFIKILNDIRETYGIARSRFFRLWKDELVSIELSEKCVEFWLSLTPISRIDYDLSCGIPPNLREDYILRRFLVRGYSVKKIELHIYSIDIRQYAIPFVPIWNRAEGLLTVGKEDIESVLEVGTRKILEKAENIVKGLKRDATSAELDPLNKCVIQRLIEEFLPALDARDIKKLSRLNKEAICIDEIIRRGVHSVDDVRPILHTLRTKGELAIIIEKVLNRYIECAHQISTD